MGAVYTNVSMLHFPMFVATWGTFFAVAIAGFFIQLKASGNGIGVVAFIRHCFPFEEWKRKTARIDIVMYIVSKFIKRLYGSFELLLTAAIAIPIQAALSYLFPTHDPVPFGFVTIIICSFVVFLVVDFANFYSHYLQHFVPVLWELHKVHHSATFLSPATTERMHPLGDIFDGIVAAAVVGVPVGLIAFLYGFSIPDILILLANANIIGTILVLDVLRHSHFPISFGRFDKYLLSPHMHQLHHSSQLEYWDKNFGNKLSIWDRLFGTAMVPSKNEKFIYGLGKPEQEEYNSIVGAYISPIPKIFRLVYGRIENPQASSQFPGKRRLRLGEGVLWRGRATGEAYPSKSEPPPTVAEGVVPVSSNKEAQAQDVAPHKATPIGNI